jgi:hypothetical protein
MKNMNRSQYKIVVTGPYAAGKSTFVRALCGDAVSIDSFGTTVVMDYGLRRYQEIDVSVFGTPGQSRFNHMIKIISKDADGIILVIDSAFPETWHYALNMINRVINVGSTPYIIAANKQDLANARSPEDIKKELNVNVPIIGTIAITGENVEKVLSMLMKEVEEL